VAAAAVRVRGVARGERDSEHDDGQVSPHGVSSGSGSGWPLAHGPQRVTPGLPHGWPQRRHSSSRRVSRSG
jgi:hypothetical protein